jgi:hypothetical protein
MKRKKRKRLEMVLSKLGECSGCVFEKKKNECKQHPCIINNQICVKYKYSR